MSFLKGLTSGQQVAQGWLDTYEKSRKDKEASDLKAKREGILTAKPEYSQDYTAAQREQFGYMTEARDNEGRPFYNVQTDSSGNYSVTPNFPTGQTPQVGLTEGLQDNADIAGQLQTRANLQAAQAAPQPIALPRERVANFLGGRVEGDLTPERMEILRSRALANTLVDPLERQRALVQLDENERAARRAEQVNTLTGLQIDAARTTAQRESEAATREEANRTAVLQVGQMLQTGGNIDIPSLYKVASATGADPTVLVKTAADFLNITEKSAKATTDKLLRDIDAASVSPTKFNTLLKNSFDPDPNDNLSPELRPAAGGGFQVFYGDKPMTQVFKDTADMPALSQMASFYRDRLSGNPLATAVQIEALNAKRAAIRASDATVRYRDQQGKALDAAKGLTQKQEDFQRALDGVFEGYQSAKALGPQGRQAAAIYASKYDQLRANTPKGLRAPPSIAAMNEAQRADKPEKPVKVEDAGVQYKVGGKLMQTDGRGGLISAKGILPDDRPTVLKTVGISDNNASRLMWSDDGETVMFNNEEFDIRDKRDVEKLNKMLKDYDVMNRTIAEEARLRANPTSPSGFQGARTTGIGPASTYGVAPGAQSIYGR